LFPGREIEPVDLVIHAREEGLIVVRAEAHVHYRRAVLKGPNQVRLLGAVGDLIEVHVLVP
jgi:hypothetical protein